MTQAWGWCATATAAAVLVITQLWGGNPFEAWAFTMGMTIAFFLVLTGSVRLARRRKKKRAEMSDRDGRTGS
jgi:uncharacterized membrane protein